MLDDQQKRKFKNDGYLAISSAIDSELVERGRSVIWDSIPEERGDTESLYTSSYRGSPDLTNQEPFIDITEQMYEYAEGLVGDKVEFPSYGMQTPLNYPNRRRLSEFHARRRSPGDDAGPHAHLDGYGGPYRDPDGRYAGMFRHFTLGAMVYFSDVDKKGGGFTVWPGTHWIAADYFESHSIDSLSWRAGLPAIDDQGGWEYDKKLSEQVRSKEITGKAGTLILYHNKLLHANSHNQSNKLRMAGIARFQRSDGAENVHDAAMNPWKYWDGIAE